MSMTYQFADINAALKRIEDEKAQALKKAPPQAAPAPAPVAEQAELADAWGYADYDPA